jgi:hypothetical protein
MTKKSPETLVAICNTIASGVMSYAAAARLNGVSVDSFWRWIKRSQRNEDPDLIIEYLGELVPFASAINAARRIALHEARGRMEQRSILGHDEPIFYNGMPTWQPDPVTVGWTEDEREALGFERDGLLRENGKVVQNVLHHVPPVALQLRVAEMAFPKEYRPGVNNSVDVTHTVTGSKHIGPVNYALGPPAVPPPPARPAKLPALEVLGGVDEIEIPEIDPDEDDIDLAEMLGEGPSSETDPAEAPSAEPVPDGEAATGENVIRDVPTERETIAPPTPTPRGYAEVPEREPRNALERDLFQKLREARERAANV